MITWLVVWNMFYLSIYWEDSSQLTNIFQTVETTNQILDSSVIRLFVRYQFSDDETFRRDEIFFKA
jgi:hypothetical protein